MSKSKYRAEEAGRLPEDSASEVSGVRVPDGHLVTPDSGFFARQYSEQLHPVLWVTSDPVRNVASVSRRIAATFPAHGLWPLVLNSLRGNDRRPWLVGEFDPAASTRPEMHEPETVLSRWWNYAIPIEKEEKEAFKVVMPFGRKFPGLAPASRSLINTNELYAATSGLSGRLGLVACTRPADVVSVIGWQGPANYYTDMGPLSAVLRSWEERFGAYVVGMGFDTLALAVQQPLSDLKTAQVVAAEHYAMCPDNITQGVGSIRAYAETLIGESLWMFWWD